MKFADYLKPVPSWSVDEVRAFIRDHEPEAYNLLDVRLSGEYRREHLPGARLAPLDRVRDAADSLDMDKPTLVYCAAGVRSRAAAAVLMRHGFRDVHSMAGGLRAWDGLTVKPAPGARTVMLSGSEDPLDLVAIAWIMEHGSSRFYHQYGAQTDNAYAAWAFREIAADEDRHMKTLKELVFELSGETADDDFAWSRVEGGEDLMEDGASVADTLAWAAGQSAAEVARLAMAMETNAYDLHLQMERACTNPTARKIFRALAKQEHLHLQRMERLLTGELGENL